MATQRLLECLECGFVFVGDPDESCPVCWPYDADAESVLIELDDPIRETALHEAESPIGHYGADRREVIGFQNGEQAYSSDLSVEKEND